MMRSLLVASFLGAAHAISCSEYTGTTCRVAGCGFMADPGDASCVDGLCKCNEGSCAYGSKCIKPSGCDKRTHGTCRIFPCGNSRGYTDCTNGFCACQDDACSGGGSCEKPCEPRTGGTCTAFACNVDRNSVCERPGSDYWGPHGYRCVCPEGTCNAGGTCYPAKNVGVKASNHTWPHFDEEVSVLEEFRLFLPNYNDPLLVLLLAVFVSIAAGLVIKRRMRRSVNPPEAMLG